jgi:probable metal-binding protein
MAQSIHGHEVMHLMLELGGSFTRDSLQLAIHERFGSEARFHTCSAEGMDAAALIEFLHARGKFVDHEAGFSTEAERICNH